MLYEAIATTTAIAGLLLLLLALRLLLRRGWLLGWLKGMLGLVLAVVALVFAFAAWDILSYEELMADTPLATISFKRLGEKHYLGVVNVATTGSEQKFELRGDQWQLDARILKWHSGLARLGIKPGYRLGRLAGRYYALEDERSANRTVYELQPSGSAVDVWDWFNRVDRYVPWLDALYGNATFAPMSDGALYEISLTHSGLLSRPLNDAARQALQRWQ